MMIRRVHRHLVRRTVRLDARGILDQLAAGHLVYTSLGRSSGSINDHTISIPWLRVLIEAKLITKLSTAHDGGTWWRLTTHGRRLYAAMLKEPATFNPGGIT